MTIIQLLYKVHFVTLLYGCILLWILKFLATAPPINTSSQQPTGLKESNRDKDSKNKKDYRRSTCIVLLYMCYSTLSTRSSVKLRVPHRGCDYAFFKMDDRYRYFRTTLWGVNQHHWIQMSCSSLYLLEQSNIQLNFA